MLGFADSAQPIKTQMKKGRKLRPFYSDQSDMHDNIMTNLIFWNRR